MALFFFFFFLRVNAMEITKKYTAVDCIFLPEHFKKDLYTIDERSSPIEKTKVS